MKKRLFVVLILLATFLALERKAGIFTKMIVLELQIVA